MVTTVVTNLSLFAYYQAKQRKTRRTRRFDRLFQLKLIKIWRAHWDFSRTPSWEPLGYTVVCYNEFLINFSFWCLISGVCFRTKKFEDFKVRHSEIS